MTNEELLAAWDAGQPVKLVEMGLGWGKYPSYEMAIQLTGLELLRVLIEEKVDWTTFNDLPDDEAEALLHGWEAKARPRLEAMGVRDLTGAQMDAARSIAGIFYRFGYEKAMTLNSAGGGPLEDRIITITKTINPEEMNGSRH